MVIVVVMVVVIVVVIVVVMVVVIVATDETRKCSTRPATTITLRSSRWAEYMPNDSLDFL